MEPDENPDLTMPDFNAMAQPTVPVASLEDLMRASFLNHAAPLEFYDNKGVRTYFIRKPNGDTWQHDVATLPMQLTNVTTIEAMVVAHNELKQTEGAIRLDHVPYAYNASACENSRRWNIYRPVLMIKKSDQNAGLVVMQNIINNTPRIAANLNYSPAFERWCKPLSLNQEQVVDFITTWGMSDLGIDNDNLELLVTNLNNVDVSEARSFKATRTMTGTELACNGKIGGATILNVPNKWLLYCPVFEGTESVVMEVELRLIPPRRDGDDLIFHFRMVRKEFYIQEAIKRLKTDLVTAGFDGIILN